MSQQLATTIYRHPAWKPDRKPIPLLQEHTIAKLADEILTHNTNNGYTGVNFIGESGTGKSTLMNTILHRIHQKKTYSIKWFFDYDMTKLIQILDALPKVPTILVFDDATEFSHDLTESEIKAIAKKLTRVRHDVQSPVICFTAFHYSRAFEKIFRNVSIKVITSISDEERVNYSQLFRGSNNLKMRGFENIFYNQTFRGRFKIGTDSWTGSAYYYKTNDPFRCALVAGIGHLHYVLYPAESCPICASPERVKTQTMTAQQLRENGVAAYDDDLWRQVVRQYLLTTKGIDIVPTNFRSCWNFINYADKNFFIDWHAVAADTEENLIRPRKKGYKFTKRASLVKKELENKIKNRLPDIVTKTPIGL